MDAKHTPGPWTCEANWACSGPLKGAYVKAGGVSLAMVQSQTIESQEMCMANGNLMAAAPDLLAVVSELSIMFDDAVFVWGIDDEDMVEKVRNAAKAAIAKAVTP